VPVGRLAATLAALGVGHTPLISSYRNTRSRSAIEPDGLVLLRYLDIVLVVVGAPILILMGASAAGYAVGAGAWIVLRVVGVAMDRFLAANADARREISLRLAYLIARVFLLALAIILVRKSDGKDAALTSLGVIVFAFTVALVVSFLDRPKGRR
jgi:hypothetical protein